MPEFKATVSDPKSAKSYKLDLKGRYANPLLDKKIGDELDGVLIGLPGYKLVLTGGSDRDGFPMRKDLARAGRKSLLLASGAGFKPKHKGIRRKRTVHGNIISASIVQVNFKIKEHGPKSIDELIKLGATR